MPTPSALFFGLMFSAVGVGFFIYGKRQSRLVAMLAGVGLCVFPYFVESAWLLVLIGSAFLALPFIVRE